MKKLYIVALVTLFSSCISFVSSFQSRGIFIPFNGNYGYSHVQLGEAYFEVGFSGSDNFAPTLLKELALIRAAELARERNFKYLEVISSRQDLVSLGTTEKTSSTFSPPDSAKKGSKETVTNVRNNNRYDIVLTVRFYSDSNITSLLYTDTILENAKSNPNYRKE